MASKRLEIINKSYKGWRFMDTVYIMTGTGIGDCGYVFEVGQIYVVYAGFKKVENESLLRFRPCQWWQIRTFCFLKFLGKIKSSQNLKYNIE